MASALTRAQAAALLDRLASDHPAFGAELARREWTAYRQGYDDRGQDQHPTGRRGEAARWLTRTLAQGPRTRREIGIASSRAGYSFRTVERASKAIGVIKVPPGPRQPWVWRLPEVAMSTTEPDATPHH